MGLSWARLLAILWAVTMATTPAMCAFGGHADRVLLQDVQVLTLHKDRMTSGRRSSPVPQLTCVGGTAKGYFTPSVVQCYNRGSDGHEVQWECKTDMDNAFRFGSVEVTCEGYGYPDDPYILKGSCGLEYTLDLTDEGYQRYKQQKSGSYGGHHDDSHHHSSHYGSWGHNSKSVVGDLLFLGGVVLVIYIVYKSCLAPNPQAAAAGADNSHRPRTDMGGDPPPPYGFQPEYMPGTDSCAGGATYSSSSTHHNTHTGTADQGGGFWTGAATGGLLGYLFGRNTGYGGYTQYQQPYGSWGSGYQRPYSSWFSGGGNTRRNYGGSFFGGGGGGGGGSSWGASSSSSGTRTASGFGGTKRR